MLVCFIPFVCVPTTMDRLTICSTNYYVQANSLHETALVPKWDIIYTPPWTFLESSPTLSEGFL